MLIAAVVAVAGGCCVPAGAGAETKPDGPQIVELYPNPVAENNTGEYVVVEFPEPTNTTGWTLTDDGREKAHLPNQTYEGRVAFSLDPGYAANTTDAPVEPLDGWLRPAVTGDRIELRQDGVVVDSVEYDSAPESERWVRTDKGGTWVQVGATDHAVHSATPEQVAPFVLPDSGGTPAATLRDAEDRLLVAGYTVESAAVADAVIDAHERGVDVAVLVDGSPVGGITRQQTNLLDRLVAAGVDIRVLGGEHARYRFHHAKYAVVDDQALVTTENWKPAGTGGADSRGWGVVVDDAALAAALSAVFEQDRAWRDGIEWELYRSHVEPVEGEQATGSFPTRFEQEPMSVDAARLLVAPDNAETELRALLANATDSIRIQQVSVGDLDSALMSATLDAARRGVEVELQLSTAWYVEEENRALADRLETLAAEEDLHIDVELIDSRSRFGTIHTKGVIVDDYHVVVGSINWNDHSLRENREVAVVLSGDAVAAYYGAVLTADRRGGHWRLTYGLVLTLLGVCLATTAVCWRRLTFRPRSRGSYSPAPEQCPPGSSSQQGHQSLPPDDQRRT